MSVWVVVWGYDLVIQCQQAGLLHFQGPMRLRLMCCALRHFSYLPYWQFMFMPDIAVSITRRPSVSMAECFNLLGAVTGHATPPRSFITSCCMALCQCLLAVTSMLCWLVCLMPWWLQHTSSHAGRPFVHKDACKLSLSQQEAAKASMAVETRWPDNISM
jgi:hypothetical protein